MAWVETESLSFTARHETDDEACAQRTLDRLEDLRLRLEDRFDDAPGGITAVIHPNPGWLAAAHPFLQIACVMAVTGLIGLIRFVALRWIFRPTGAVRAR